MDVLVNFAALRIAAGLLLLIAANIVLGSIGAIIDGTWDKKKFFNGCIKGAAIAVALIAVYSAGYLNPDVLTIDIDGTQVNLMSAVYVTLLTAFTMYAVDIIKKLKDMLLGSTPGTEDDNE